MEDTLEKALKWRYATKKFDPRKKLSDQKLNALLESLRLAPSSNGLQPWKFLVVTNPGVRKQIKEVAHQQLQIVDASHLIVLTRPLNIDVDLIDRHIANTARIRGVPVDSMAKYRNSIVNSIRSKTSEDLVSWATAQIYIALGFLLESAALLGVDACPMEGFDKEKLDGVLGLSEKGLASVVICALGHRSEEDKYASIQKSRFLREEVFEFLV